MADRPILFSAPMVRALLAGRKTQTRRLLKGIEELPNGKFHIHGNGGGLVGVAEEDVSKHAPDYVRIQPEDRVWVKETWRAHAWHGDCVEIAYAAQRGIVGWSQQHEQIKYPDGNRNAFKYYAPKGPDFWRPSIFMPRWASRITLVVTDVRVERLQDITNEDCIAEGVPVHPNENAPRTGPAIDAFARMVGLISHYGAEYRRIWQEINGAGSWDENPWIIAYTFSVHLGNIDQIARAA
ncbi:hypothetical protein [Rhizobium rhizogenes]|uniref:hypothetical protein n=1 Tax=Rhizobium rhizogenes TaxID=359 RepID=UPI003866C2D5